MQELKNLTLDNQHVLVTEPDRIFNDSIVILLVDWPADLIDQALRTVSGASKKLSIHIFSEFDNNYLWLLDVANQADIIAINTGKVNHIDLLKGLLISKNQSFYFGRSNVQKLFLNFTDDPIGKLLIKLGEKISQMEEK